MRDDDTSPCSSRYENVRRNGRSGFQTCRFKDHVSVSVNSAETPELHFWSFLSLCARTHSSGTATLTPPAMSQRALTTPPRHPLDRCRQVPPSKRVRGPTTKRESQQAAGRRDGKKGREGCKQRAKHAVYCRSSENSGGGGDQQTPGQNNNTPVKEDVDFPVRRRAAALALQSLLSQHKGGGRGRKQGSGEEEAQPGCCCCCFSHYVITSCERAVQTV